MSSKSVPGPAGSGPADPGATPNQALKSPPRRKLLPLWLSIFGLLSLSYLLGAAVMFFELPSSGFLGKAFVGARAWNERRQVGARISSHHELPPLALGRIDQPGKTFDGFTLCTFASLTASSTQAFLINMRGEVVHKWVVSFSRIWPHPPHISAQVDDSFVCFFGCHLYANGDLLVTFHGLQNVANGYGLAKLDKDSNVVWKYSANVHHDVDVSEDGTIYAIKHEIVNETPKGLESIPPPYLLDYLVLLSPDGKELRRPIPIFEAFQNSAYAPLLSWYEKPVKQDPQATSQAPSFVDAQKTDLLHMNFVQVLSRKLAPKFPMFKAGQILISLRNIDTIAVLDADQGAVVWAARGPWRRQHDSQFLDNGHLLIFDNRGSAEGSRVLEYDPQTQAFPWSYAGENRAPFYTEERGMGQRLPNGNTLVVNSQGREMVEVSRSKEVVWSCSLDGYIHVGRRFSADQLHFLEGGQRARP